jgi:hypothetical protein
VILALLTAGCDSGPVEMLETPQELRGRWVTRVDPAYAKAYLELGEQLVQIGTVEGTRLTFRLSRVLVSESPSVVKYRILYQDQEGEEYSLNYSAASREATEIWASSRPAERWYRQEAES